MKNAFVTQLLSPGGGIGLRHRRRRRGARAPPLKFGKQYFSGNYYVKFGHFSGKNSVKFGNFVNFSEKIVKIRVFFLIFGQESCKIRAFC